MPSEEPAVSSTAAAEEAAEDLELLREVWSSWYGQAREKQRADRSRADAARHRERQKAVAAGTAARRAGGGAEPEAEAGGDARAPSKSAQKESSGRGRGRGAESEGWVTDDSTAQCPECTESAAAGGGEVGFWRRRVDKPPADMVVRRTARSSQLPHSKQPSAGAPAAAAMASGSPSASTFRELVDAEPTAWALPDSTARLQRKAQDDGRERSALRPWSGHAAHGEEEHDARKHKDGEALGRHGGGKAGGAGTAQQRSGGLRPRRRRQQARSTISASDVEQPVGPRDEVEVLRNAGVKKAEKKTSGPSKTNGGGRSGHRRAERERPASPPVEDWNTVLHLVDTLVADISLFESMTKEERAKMADVLQPAAFSAGDYLITQGDPGDAMYILAAGVAVATIVPDAGPERGKPIEVAKYKVGEFFGCVVQVSNLGHRRRR